MTDEKVQEMKDDLMNVLEKYEGEVRLSQVELAVSEFLTDVIREIDSLSEQKSRQKGDKE